MHYRVYILSCMFTVKRKSDPFEKTPKAAGVGSVGGKTRKCLPLSAVGGYYTNLPPRRSCLRKCKATSGFLSGRKQLSRNILERFELECVPGRVQEEHGCLLAG